MIDLDNETAIPIREAPRHFPGRPNVSTVYRWILQHTNPLETFKVGGRRFTTIEACRRFIERANEPKAITMSAKRKREIDAANRELDERGVY